MAMWSLPRQDSGNIYAPNGLTGGLPTGASVTTGSSANTKGSWTQIIADTGTSPWRGFWIYHPGNYGNSTNTSMMIDVGIGTAGNEVVILSDVQCGYLSGATWQYVPLYVPAGARMAIRGQSTGARTYNWDIVGNIASNLVDAAEAFGYATTYGANEATTLGVQVTPTSGGLGSIAQITASTTAPIHALQVLCGANGSNNLSNASLYLQIFVGGAGSEVAISRPLFVSMGSNEWITAPDSYWGLMPVRCSIPAGTRLSAKCYQNTAVNSLDTTIIGYSR